MIDFALILYTVAVFGISNVVIFAALRNVAMTPRGWLWRAAAQTVAQATAITFYAVFHAAAGKG